MSEEDIDVNESEHESADELDSSTNEETEAQLQKLKEENERLKSHLRNKEEKKKETATQAMSEEDVAILREVQAKLKKQEDSAKEIAYNQMLQEDWGKRYSSEEDPEGNRVAELNQALSLVNQRYPVLTPDDYKRNLRRAHLMIAEEQQQDTSAQEAKSIKQSAGGITGSSTRKSDVSLEAALGKLSPQDQRVIERTNARRARRGEEPITATDIK